jgi:ubiquinone/menaquinone biosynthesis C-methylase UbiE
MTANAGGCCGGGTAEPVIREDANGDEIKARVREVYAAAITADEKTGQSGCGCGCSEGPSGTMQAALSGSHATRIGYSEEELADLPEHAATHAFGCGNPLAFSGVKEGDVVLDLGSGAGIDVLLAAKKVGPQGHVIGLDMTPEMLEKARKNASEANATNVEFRHGEMENMPVEDSSVDWIISNCVISLSPDKDAVFSEAFRVLKPGGHILVSDICINDVEKSVRAELFTWADCIGGALDETSYLSAIEGAGFSEVQIVDRYAISSKMLAGFSDNGEEFTKDQETDRDALWQRVDNKVSSVRVYALKAESAR